MSLLSAPLDLIFPAKCPFCGRVLDRPGICDACRGELPWTEGADALRRGPAAFSARRLCGTRAWPERGSTASSSGGCPLLRRPWES